MKKSVIALAALAMATCALATKPQPTTPPGHSGGGITAAVGLGVAYGRQDVYNVLSVAPAMNTYANPSAASSSVASTDNFLRGASFGNSLSVTNVPRQAPSTVGVPVPSTAKSCRLFFSLFGSNTGGSLGGGIPLGNDQTCLSWSQLDMMTEVNNISGQMVFSVSDFKRAACRIEGMGEMDGCKAVTTQRTEREAP